MIWLLANWRPLLGALAMAFCFGAGWTVQGWRRDAAEQEARDAALELQRENRRGANTAAAAHEADKVKVQTEFVTITQTVEKIVEKPVYRNVCFDPDGMRALDAALAAGGSAAGKPGAAVPGSDATR